MRFRNERERAKQGEDEAGEKWEQTGAERNGRLTGRLHEQGEWNRRNEIDEIVLSGSQCGDEGHEKIKKQGGANPPRKRAATPPEKKNPSHV